MPLAKISATILYRQNMHITSLKLTNYKLYKQAEFNFTPGVNVLYGKNGGGKTSILEALATMMAWYIYMIRDTKSERLKPNLSTIRHGASSAKISTNLQFNEKLSIPFSIEFSKKSNSPKVVTSTYRQHNFTEALRDSAHNHAVRYPIMAYYGIHRIVTEIPVRLKKHREYEVTDGYKLALSGNSNFRSFFEWFREREDEENEAIRDDATYRDAGLECVRKAWEVLLPTLTNFRVRRSPLSLKASKNGTDLSVSQLSDGEKCTLALVGDIARRLSLLNSQCSTLHSQDILDSQGIILIDEIDLHLHPEWQREIISKLPEVFPNIQFIVTTHSPSIISEIPTEQLINTEAPDIQPDLGRGYSTGEVLEYTMGVPIWPKQIDSLIKQIRTLTDAGNAKSASEKLSELRQLLPPHAPILTSLETEIDLFA